jgi:hypothetical protein
MNTAIANSGLSLASLGPIIMFLGGLIRFVVKPLLSCVVACNVLLCPPSIIVEQIVQCRCLGTSYTDVLCVYGIWFAYSIKLTYLGPWVPG